MLCIFHHAPYGGDEMRNLYSEKTLDDLLRVLIKNILKNGTLIYPSKGKCYELTGILIELENPRARLSRTETRGRPFSCLGELCWYLAKTNNTEFITYYIKKYEEVSEDKHVHGGYGPRLFNWKNINQVEQVISILKENTFSRKAVIQLFDSTDLLGKHKDIPCTCNLQFLIRNDKLHLITSMRSNDVWLGFPHDIFCFTMLQEIIARNLSIDIGSYKHFVGSLHLYETDIKDAKQFLREGWQTTTISMPPMPFGDPWPSISSLLIAEEYIRNNGYSQLKVNPIEPYWADLIRLLKIYGCYKNKDQENIRITRDEMDSQVYNSIINKKIDQLENVLKSK